ncbi:shikimate kinase [Alkalibacter mobilis]|uniref:shikimate kinase n=1 Tax=Alkalibacter mobilis TaxID=2787712 RepID=UPI0018A07034|nr:shikimate kinase [Alkalibacter mobilis]MBF7096442.1 shikimate kinase [Alkalibacter mobilis]
MKKGQNVYLIGFMGSGKSTVAEYLSRSLNLKKYEMDELIVAREKMSIAKIFELHGEKYFRDRETEVLAELQNKDRAVVSCGGGVVLRDENVEMMKEHGKIVLLQANPETIYERVKDSDERPVLNDNMNVGFIKELMEKRSARYLDSADVVVETDGKMISEICGEIKDKLSWD